MGNQSVSGMHMNDDTVRISVSEDFSIAPAGRLKTDGPKSGEAFRCELLVPALERAQHVTINLDNTEGYGSSFLEEAFGGLVRDCGYSQKELAGALEFISEEDPTIPDEIFSYISDAQHIAQSA